MCNSGAKRLIFKLIVNVVTIVLDRSKIYVTDERDDSKVNNTDAYKKECCKQKMDKNNNVCIA
jgi:hypothetical protein